MPTRRVWSFLAAVVAALGMAGTSRADFVIDDFSVPSPASFYLIDLLNSNPYTRTDALSNGLTRNLSVTVQTPNPTNPNSASGFIGTRPSGTPSGPLFSMDSDNSSTVISNLSYTGFVGALANFSLVNAIHLDFLNLDSGIATTTTPLSIDLITSSGTLNYSGFVSDSNVPFTFSAYLSSFTGSGDLTQVTGLNVTLNGGASSRQAADFVLDRIRVSTVPAPPAALLGLLALPILGLYRRQRESAGK